MFSEAVRRNADWLVTFHPDMYVAPAEIERELSVESPVQDLVLTGHVFSRPDLLCLIPEIYHQPIHSGAPGCAPMILSRAALRRLLEKGLSVFRNEIMIWSRSGQKMWEDNALACSLQYHRIPAAKYDGAFFNNLNDNKSSGSKAALHAISHDTPRSFLGAHNVDRRWMHILHNWVLNGRQ